MSAGITPGDTAPTKVNQQVEPERFFIHLRPVIHLTDGQLVEICQIDAELWIKRWVEGDIGVEASFFRFVQHYEHCVE